MRSRVGAVLCLAMLGSLLPGVAHAAAVSTSCSFDPGTATVNAVIGSSTSPVLERSGEEIWFGGSACVGEGGIDTCLGGPGADVITGCEV